MIQEDKLQGIIDDIMKGEIRHFQAEDLPFFVHTPRSLMLYEPRLGKTVMSSWCIGLDTNCRKIVIACPKNAMFVWKEHIERFVSELRPEESLDIRLVRQKGKAASNAKIHRKAQWLKPCTSDITVWIVTWGSFLADRQLLQLPSTRKSGVVFDTFIGDEVHMRMINRKTKTVAQVKELSQRCHRIHLLSGTMASKGGPADLWACLNILNRQRFSSYWRHVNLFCEVIDNGFGQEIIGVKNPKMWWAELDQFARRRFRKDVAPQMPKVQRELIKIEATTEQQDLIYKLDQEQFAFTPDGMIVASTSMETILRKRQILTCPKILDQNLGYGAAIEDLVERLQDESMFPTPESRQIVIFSAFRKALPFFEEYLRANGFPNVWQLYGAMEPELQQERIRKYRETKGIILCSTRYAQAFSLEPAIDCYHIGYEWNPNDNKQAEDRLVPQQGIHPITSGYYTHIGLDEWQSHAVNIKNQLITLTLGNLENSPD